MDLIIYRGLRGRACMAIGTHGVKKAACNLMRVTCGGSAVHHCTNCDRPGDRFGTKC
jgi:hypothetical protein